MVRGSLACENAGMIYPRSHLVSEDELREEGLVFSFVRFLVGSLSEALSQAKPSQDDGRGQ
jgi:hypothetical protein